MLRLSVFLLSFLLLVSCVNNPPVVPEDIIQEEQMKTVLVDIYLVEGTLQATDKLRPEDLPLAKAYYEQVLKKHGLSMEQFNKSIKWYSAHHALFEKIHEGVMEELSTRQSQLSGKP